jgi:hypothetical protein
LNSEIEDIFNVKDNYTKVPNSIIWTEVLSKNAKLLFVVIASRTPSYPSYRLILKNMSSKNKLVVSKALRELVLFNILYYIKGTQNKSNRYFVNPLEDWRIDVKGTLRTCRGNKSNLDEDLNRTSNKTNEIKIINETKSFPSTQKEEKSLSGEEVSNRISNLLTLII